MKRDAPSQTSMPRPRIAAPGVANALLAVALLAASGCGGTPATQAPRAQCRIADFMGDWTSAARGGALATVTKDTVALTAGHERISIRYVEKRDLGLVSRQVLRQEFARLAARGDLPMARRGPDETVCAIQLIRPEGAAALVAEGPGKLFFLQENRTENPPPTTHLRRSGPRPTPGPVAPGP